MKSIAYLRVSSRGQGWELQKDTIAKAAKTNGDEIVEWRSEKQSAKTMDRPVLKSILADAGNGILKRVYVFKLDRLTRTGVSDTFESVSKLRRGGCELIAIVDNIHVKVGEDDTVTDVLLFAFSLAAKLERLARNERIAAKREVMEAQGEKWGRPRRLTDEQIEKIVAMRDEGRTLRECAQAMSCPKSTIALALSRNAEAKNGIGPPTETATFPIPPTSRKSAATPAKSFTSGTTGTRTKPQKRKKRS